MDKICAARGFAKTTGSNPVPSALKKKIKHFLQHELRRQRSYLWGKYIVFKPYLVQKVWGDGLQIIYFGSIDDRPHWWAARIDSKTDIEDDKFDWEEILMQIESECDRPGEWNNYKPVKYPGINWSGGHWGLIKNFGVNEKETHPRRQA